MKKNNKGFSLVELIVVVLIMGIIAVALAPQVIKWVEKSRKASDATAYDELVEEIQVALVNKEAYAAAGTNQYTFDIYGDKMTVKIGSNTYNFVAESEDPAATGEMRGSGYISSTNTDALINAIYKIDPKWNSLTGKASDIKNASASTTTTDHYTVTVKTDRSVDRTSAPKADTTE